MMKKKKRLMTAVALASGVCLFSGAAFASYNTVNGYSAYKKALVNAMYENNYTVEGKYQIAIDGKIIDKYSAVEKYSEKDKMLSKLGAYNDGESKFDRYVFDGINVEVRTNAGREEAYVYDGITAENMDIRGMGEFPKCDKDDESEKKMIRFLELLADTLMGDMKNNFVYVSGDDNKDSYELKLTAVQIPELYTAGLAAMFSGNGVAVTADNYDADDPYDVLGHDPEIELISCTFDVDKKGKLLNTAINADLSGSAYDGSAHTVSFEYVINVSDYGTTVPDKVDVNSLNVVYRESDDTNVRYYETDSSDGKRYAVTGSGERMEVEVNEDGVPVTETEEFREDAAIDTDGKIYY